MGWRVRVAACCLLFHYCVLALLIAECECVRVCDFGRKHWHSSFLYFLTGEGSRPNVGLVGSVRGVSLLRVGCFGAFHGNRCMALTDFYAERAEDEMEVGEGSAATRSGLLYISHLSFSGIERFNMCRVGFPFDTRYSWSWVDLGVGWIFRRRWWNLILAFRKKKCGNMISFRQKIELLMGK